MTQETIRALEDEELVQVIAWAQQEQQVRVAKRKKETIAKIKELARSADVDITIEVQRGRPPKSLVLNPLNQQSKSYKQSALVPHRKFG